MMKEYSKKISIDDRVAFRADWVEFRRDNGGLICSLEGEFLRDGESFDPPMPYYLSNIGVPSDNLLQILVPVYKDLMHERKKS
ncbi:hypothetical protein HY772_00975 [Candidatus Woesearchaeota archaeon]|nr:hypothetical protein [Candidatus Woesearchaeota archaeon]